MEQSHWRLVIAVAAFMLCCTRLAIAAPVSGVAVDDLGDRIGKVELCFVRQQMGPFNQRSVTTDSHGRFALDLEAGDYILYCANDWDLMQPGKVHVPAIDPLRVSLQPVQFFPASGRVLSRQGKPVAGAQVTLTYEITGLPKAVPTAHQTALTNKDGRFVFSRVRPAGTIILQVNKPGWRVWIPGHIAFQYKGFDVSDTRMEALDGQIAGRILMAHGEPAAGALIGVAEGLVGSEYRTDESGAFSLRDFPNGDITLIAVHGSGYAVLKAVSGPRHVVIRLSDYNPPLLRDGQSAKQVLQQLYNREFAEDPKFFVALPVLAEFFDTDLAIKMACNSPPDRWRDRKLVDLIEAMAFQDPTAAAQKGPAVLKELAEGPEKPLACLLLAASVADRLPDLAKTQLQNFRSTSVVAPDPQTAFYERILAAICASKLNEPDAATRMEALITEAAASLKTKGTDGPSLDLLMFTALLAPKSFEDLVDRLHPDAEQIDSVTAMADISDPQLALKLFHLVQNDPEIVTETDGPMLVIGAAEGLIRSVGAADPTTALLIAQSVKNVPDRAVVLAIAAQFQPRDTALVLLREAAPDASDSGEMPAVRIAAMAYDLDPETGKQLFATIRKRLETHIDPVDAGPSSMVQFAYYFARVDPLESRYLLEMELARLPLVVAHGWGTVVEEQGKAEIAEAMAAVDGDLAMATVSTIADRWSRFETQAWIAGYWMAPPNVRNSLPLYAIGADLHTLRGEW